MKKKTGTLKPKLLVASGVIVAAVLVLGVLEITGTIHLLHSSPVVRAPGKPSYHSPVTTDKPKSPEPSSIVQQGTGTDLHGASVNNVPTDPSEWSTSSNGLVTVKLPSANGTFHSGDTIVGSASAGPVFYTLIDNQAGMISQGSISVVNSNFTATVQFTPYASGGQLDVYNTANNQLNGRQINEVVIPVKF
ncbi:MAG TPA: hypothetical protein VGS28_01890 [Candidatus Saccharimonadales bacterium]|nr:hypothetical protein [Candidatus Saccharimonadales bacterium]